jgi:hypothetical protein
VCRAGTITQDGAFGKARRGAAGKRNQNRKQGVSKEGEPLKSKKSIGRTRSLPEHQASRGQNGHSHPPRMVRLQASVLTRPPRSGPPPSLLNSVLGAQSDHEQISQLQGNYAFNLTSAPITHSFPPPPRAHSCSGAA